MMKSKLQYVVDYNMHETRLKIINKSTAGLICLLCNQLKDQEHVILYLNTEKTQYLDKYS